MLPHRLRTLWLLVASAYFYMAFVPVYVLILATLIVVDFFLAQRMARATGRARRLLFSVSLFLNIGTLFLFKYFNFFAENVRAVAELIGWNYSLPLLSLILPIGLSFHIFQGLAYVIEVYKGRYVPERNLLTYALYVMFFPQLVAGPIERPEHLLPQLSFARHTSWLEVLSGLRLMLWGFFKKIVVADRLGTLVDHVYAIAALATGPQLAIALVAFGIQLYCDFSGYTDIARGSARTFGVTLRTNFEQPFFSRSVAEFWRRWHMSLSFWFRDYVYFPLAYTLPRSWGVWAPHGALVITFLLTGLWHGAGYTYVLYGAVHGVYIVLGQLTKSWRDAWVRRVHLDRFPQFHATLQMLIVTLLVLMSWVFFRATSLTQAFEVFRGLLSGWEHLLSFSYWRFDLLSVRMLGLSKYELLLGLIPAGVVLYVDWYLYQSLPRALFVHPYVRLACVVALVLLVMNLGVTRELPFIYFQF